MVKRRFTLKGSSLTIENKEGAMFRAPQKILDEMIGKLAFDPMAFMRLQAVDQFKNLAEHAGLDFSDIDAKRKAAFEERTVVNRTGKAKKAEVEAIVVPDNAPDEVVSSSAILEKLAAANKTNDAISEESRVLSDSIVNRQNLDNEIADLADKLQTMRSDLIDFDAGIKARTKKLAEREKVDIDPINKSLETLDDDNDGARAKEKFTVENKALTELLAKSEKLTGVIGECDKDRITMIENADLPVPGLSFDDGFVTFNAIPLDQASSAEQLRVSVAVAMAMNPKLRVIRIQDGSLLDSDSMKIIEEMAKKDDFQFWVEQVDETGKVGVVIEDGMVKTDNQ